MLESRGRRERKENLPLINADERGSGNLNIRASGDQKSKPTMEALRHGEQPKPQNRKGNT